MDHKDDNVRFEGGMLLTTAVRLTLFRQTVPAPDHRRHPPNDNDYEKAYLWRNEMA